MPIAASSPYWSGRASQGLGSFSLFHGVQNRAGRLGTEEAGEAAARAIADPDQNVDSEEVSTRAAVEVARGSSPTGCPAELRRAYVWTQYVIPFVYHEAPV